MKKVAIICLALSLLSLSGCDFLRTVAGRPTSAELSEKKRVIEEKKAAADSIACRDAKKELWKLGVKFSSVFTFGNPVHPLEYGYNLIVGVYLTENKARAHYDLARKEGFSPFFIEFANGAKALCLCGSDDCRAILDAVSRAGRMVCPSDAWIYVNERL